MGGFDLPMEFANLSLLPFSVYLAKLPNWHFRLISSSSLDNVTATTWLLFGFVDGGGEWVKGQRWVIDRSLGLERGRGAKVMHSTSQASLSSHSVWLKFAVIVFLSFFDSSTFTKYRTISPIRRLSENILVPLRPPQCQQRRGGDG
ncbi:hypothetical protein KIN20_031791 [Parelaphostrongylus tenuis]|uniref:Uncharacterized protein n=1 Tax=Parelaphostrongylus tenuis TaxID=148309 RepID=A0AAD5WHI1_PARTN|nr:hypothetical protein KIN20_031791 [Parelaphostrongylus tenuis]